MSERASMIRERLEQHFAPAQVSITDDSHEHAGHAGARNGGHFTTHIISDAFDGKSTLQRHRMVYDALDDLMQTEIHALSIKAETVQENHQEG